MKARLRWTTLGFFVSFVGCDAQLGVLAGNDGSGTGGPGNGLDGSMGDVKLREFNSLEELDGLCNQLGEGPHPGDAPLRRLTRAEYNATVSDLLGDNTRPADAFPPEARALGFFGVADGQTVTTLLAEGYQSAAKALAGAAAADLPGLLGCDAEEASCVSDFLREYGSAAYRRPISDDEVARLLPVFEWGRDNLSVQSGVEMVLEVLLQSPDFLYRPEFGAGEAQNGSVRLSQHEIATRLSYLFLGSMPDELLLAAAEAGELGTTDEILAQAERLMQTGEAREAFATFHDQWLNLSEVTHIERDPNVYEGYSGAIPQLFVEETLSFIEHVIFDDDGTLKTLLTAPYTMANAELAGFYGLSGAAGSAFELVPTGSDRAGLLTHGSLLSHHAQPLQTSPTHRGKFVRESFLCQFPPAPPDDLIIVPPELDSGLTTRERFNQHAADPSCAGCHRLMDPLGLGLEHFDPVGRYRAEEHGLAIDASGELVDTDVDGDFYGATELASALSESQQVAGCITKQWVRFAHGRSEAGADACTLHQLGTAFEESNYNIRELVLALTQTDAFQYRNEVTP